MADIHIINWNKTKCYQLHGDVPAKVKVVYDDAKKDGAVKGTCKWAGFDVKNSSYDRTWKDFPVTRWTKAAKKGEEQDDLELWADSDADHFGDVTLAFNGSYADHTITRSRSGKKYCV